MSGPTMYPAPEVLVRGTAEVGEGPVFDRRTGRLCWVDIPNGKLFESSSASETAEVLDTHLGAVAPRALEPGFAAAVQEGFGFVVDGKLEVVDPVLDNPVLDNPGLRMNDAKCDSAGRLWAGSCHLDFVPGLGSLHRWDGAGPSSVRASGLALPNGIGWSPDDTTMYLIDSIEHTVFSARFDAAAGEVGEFTALFEVDTGLPDGMAVDTDGCLWVAVWGGWEVRRHAPDGTLIGRIVMPVAQPSSCAFAPDGSLVITSARAGLDEPALDRQPLAGSVFVVPTDTHGVDVAPFAG